LDHPEDVAVGVGDGGHQAAATYVVSGLVDGGTRAVTSVDNSDMFTPFVVVISVAVMLGAAPCSALLDS
jgi:hypothetical protein